MFRVLIVVCLSLLTLSPAWGQPSVPAQDLLLLVAGPSGERIDPHEQALLGYLNGLRGEYNLYNLQLGTMHFDQPKEARLLREGLGFRPESGVTIGLVQLSDQGIPVRTLYKREGVTSDSVEADYRELLGQWSTVSGESLPQALRPTNATEPTVTNEPTATTEPTVVTTTTTESGHSQTPSHLSAPTANDSVVYSFEGVRTVVTSFQEQTDALWSELRNRPLREDRLDVPVRESTARLVDLAKNLRQAHENGVIYPLEQLAAARAEGRQWKHSEPQFYLPVDLRKNVKPILQLLDQMEAIESQGRK